ncbi:hypothetical protein [Frigidibacter sp. SD6-1]|uniref:hypothetical protein n=1 Tax=Frigidibacter sp. SD6-1 TaxID=3032581 RepID=UPI0024DF6240|nr:hypothetical protein [Frigidibacter sp. SD6-1]
MRNLLKALAFSCLSAAGAEAATLQAVITGQVADGYDSSLLFGTAPTALDGQDFTLTLSYDTTLGQTVPSGGYTVLQGGSRISLSSPVDAFLTVSGVTARLAGGYYGGLAACVDPASGCSLGMFVFNMQQYDPLGPPDAPRSIINGNLDFADLLAGQSYLTGLGQPYAALVGPAGFDIFFSYTLGDPNGGGPTSYGNLIGRSFSITTAPLAPVPLPATGGALFVALCAVGALRGRRTSKA